MRLERASAGRSHPLGAAVRAGRMRRAGGSALYRRPMQRIETGRLTGRLRHQRQVQIDPGLALGLLWIVAVLVVDNSSHAHVAVIPSALHSWGARWLVVGCATAVVVAALALRDRQPLVALFAVVAAVVAAPAVLLLFG